MRTHPDHAAASQSRLIATSSIDLKSKQAADFGQLVAHCTASVSGPPSQTHSSPCDDIGSEQRQTVERGLALYLAHCQC
ncbi:MAG: hypothetical protein CBB71_10760 [Rhodopirellula sp. TMED11]|nr:MAG: hypothetical protein CBB71_10760 [Rhodopirellula sp. TMED11]